MVRQLHQLLSAGFAAGLGGLCACTLLPEPVQTQTQYFDLKLPQKIAPISIEVEPFATSSGERFRMSKRVDGTRIKSSDFHKWIQTPGSLLTKYLRLAFRNEEHDRILNCGKALTLRGEVLVFESSNGWAELGVRYCLHDPDCTLSKTVMIREKLNAETPEGFAEAMSRAARRFAQLIASEVKTVCARKP